MAVALPESRRWLSPQRAKLRPFGRGRYDLSDELRTALRRSPGSTDSAAAIWPNGNARRNVCALDGSDIAAAVSGAFSEVFLRESSFVPQAAQIGGQDILEIDADKSRT